MENLKAIIRAKEIITGCKISSKNGKHLKDEDFDSISNGALVYSTKVISGKEIPHKIAWVGPTHLLPNEFKNISTLDLCLKQILIPGLIDCHTHLIFGGNRSSEFAERCKGVSYEEIASRGGGISATVHATRQASENHLLDLAYKRARESYAFGVRTLEIKSGYGLSLESELKLLRVIQKLQVQMPEMNFVSTFLGAHAFPPECNNETEKSNYIDEIINTMLPLIAKENLASICDVFIDRGYFSINQAKKILRQAVQLGMKTKIHADELSNTESSALAVESTSLSADHLLQISENGINLIANSETVAVLLPGTAFYLKTNQAPARALLNAGATVALATDFNPGTCMTLSIPLILTFGALYLSMSKVELFASVTYSAAKALGLEKQKGSLEIGKDADFTMLPYSNFEELYYGFGRVPPHLLS